MVKGGDGVIGARSRQAGQDECESTQGDEIIASGPVRNVLATCASPLFLSLSLISGNIVTLRRFPLRRRHDQEGTLRMKGSRVRFLNILFFYFYFILFPLEIESSIASIDGK